MSDTEISPSIKVENLPNGDVLHEHHSSNDHSSNDDDHHDDENNEKEENISIEVETINNQSPSPSPFSNDKKTMEVFFESEEFKNELKRLVDSQIRQGIRPANALEQLKSHMSSNNNNNNKSMDKFSSFSSSKQPPPPPLSLSIQQHGANNLILLRNSTTPTTNPSFQRMQLPTIPINDLRNEGCFSNEEKSLRCKLAALFRLVDLHGWSHGLYSHISARLNATENVYLINQFGLLYHEVSASNLVKIDKDGQALIGENSQYGINKSGWMLHSTIMSVRRDIQCVVHLHMPDVVSISCMKCGLLPISLEADELLQQEFANNNNNNSPSAVAVVGENGDGVNKEEIVVEHGLVRYHAYQSAMGFGNTQLSTNNNNLINDLGSFGKIIFLRNHGALICGNSVEEAWRLSRLLVSACQAQARLIHLGGLQGIALNHYKKSLKTNVGGGKKPVENNIDLHLMEYEAMMRLLDNAGYRTGYHYSQPQLVKRVLGSLSDAAADILGADDSALSHANYIYDETSAHTNAKRIKDQVAANKQRASQRKQYLAREPIVSTRSHDDIIEEPVIIKPVEASIHVKTQQQTSTTISPTATQAAQTTTTTTTTVIKTTTVPAPSVKEQQDVKAAALTRSATLTQPKEPSPPAAHVSRSATMAIKSNTGTDYGTTSAASEAGSRSNTLKADERPRKKGIKIAGIRIPSFSKKKKEKENK